MNDMEIGALLDVHDALVKAYVDETLTFLQFVSAMGSSRTIMRSTRILESRPSLPSRNFFENASHSICWSPVFYPAFDRPMMLQTFRMKMRGVSCRMSC